LELLDLSFKKRAEIFVMSYLILRMAKLDPETSPLLSFDKGSGFDLWQEHARTLRSWDDLSLARWLNQTLGQLYEHCWRASHPLVVAYRLGATVANQRDLWNRRTFSLNTNYPSASCCGAPTIPFISFEVCSHGLYCSCCGDILLTVEDLSPSLAVSFRKWGSSYERLHQVAHWTDEERRRCGDYDKALDQAADQASPLLARLGYQLSPKALSIYPAIFWEDADNCLDIIPEDVVPPTE
jgi:hypothetical protein